MTKQEEFLDILKKLKKHLMNEEKVEFSTIKKVSKKKISNQQVRDAKHRDVIRELEAEEEYKVIDKTKDFLICKLMDLIPESKFLLEKLEYSFWDEKKIERSTSSDIMLSNDWQKIIEFIEFFVKSKNN
jgi:hypothetical protein